jgi:tyrosinase
MGLRGSESDLVCPRVEIRKLERRLDDFNVFLLGLQRLQDVPQDNKLSYYEIAGNCLTRPSM